jgi:cell shape-determining protein MreC
MLFWTIQITVISFILIFLVHYLINFFKTTLTVPKIKDLVNTPMKKYESMYNIISKTTDDVMLDLDNSELLPKPNQVMKNELKNFLKKQMNESSSTDLSTLDSRMNTYSEFK